jgi:hypothetical protein
MQTWDIDAVHRSYERQQADGMALADEEVKHRGHVIQPHSHAPGSCSSRFWCETDHMWFTGASCPGIDVPVRRPVSKRSYR